MKWCSLLLSAVLSFATTARSAQPVAIERTRHQLTQLRDDFVAATRASGIACRIKPPKIIVHDVPSYGSFDPDTNTLTSPAWEQLSADERALFFQGAGPRATQADARAEFELGVHHWVIVHELGHWWEACRGMVDHGDHYGFELTADRIAAAYWNEHDRSVIEHQQAVFDGILKRWPDPVPAGATPKAYFDDNYQALAPTRAYIWFQAQMCITAFRETPLPAFTAALRAVADIG